MYRCERCGMCCEGASKLVGEYVVLACARCLSSWNLFVRGESVFEHYTALKIGRDNEIADRVGGARIDNVCVKEAQALIRDEIALHRLASEFFRPNLAAAISNAKGHVALMDIYVQADRQIKAEKEA